MKSGWQNQALCRQTDPETFFPDINKGGNTRPAKNICGGSCDVRIDCLEYALDNNEQFGIWGGLSAPERARVAKQREQTGRIDQKTCALTECDELIPLGSRETQTYCTTRHGRLAAERRLHTRKKEAAA